MPYIIHYRDDTDDKPDTVDEETARTLLHLQFKDERMRELRWKELQSGVRVCLPRGGYVEREEGTP
jgi:hypothetical protein